MHNVGIPRQKSSYNGLQEKKKNDYIDIFLRWLVEHTWKYYYWTPCLTINKKCSQYEDFEGFNVYLQQLFNCFNNIHLFSRWQN